MFIYHSRLKTEICEQAFSYQLFAFNLKVRRYKKPSLSYFLFQSYKYVGNIFKKLKFKHARGYKEIC